MYVPWCYCAAYTAAAFTAPLFTSPWWFPSLSWDVPSLIRCPLCYRPTSNTLDCWHTYHGASEHPSRHSITNSRTSTKVGLQGCRRKDSVPARESESSCGERTRPTSCNSSTSVAPAVGRGCTYRPRKTYSCRWDVGDLLPGFDGRNRSSLAAGDRRTHLAVTMQGDPNTLLAATRSKDVTTMPNAIYPVRARKMADTCTQQSFRWRVYTVRVYRPTNLRVEVDNNIR